MSIEQAFDALDRQGFDLVDDLAAAVVTLARQAFGILVGKDIAHRRDHIRRGEVLGGDEFQAFLLPMKFSLDES